MFICERPSICLKLKTLVMIIPNVIAYPSENTKDKETQYTFFKIIESSNLICFPLWDILMSFERN